MKSVDRKGAEKERTPVPVNNSTESGMMIRGASPARDLKDWKAWIKENPLLSFILVSVIIHLIVLGLVRDWDQGSVPADLPKIEFDYYEIQDGVEQEVLEISDPYEAPDIKIEPDTTDTDNPVSIDPEIIIPADKIIEETPPSAPTRDSSHLEPNPAEALAGYISYLQNVINQKLEYPDRASRERREGQVTVIFTLDKSGRLLSLHIPPEGMAGFHPFNRAALTAVRSASRYFDSFPEILTEETITFRLPISFTRSLSK